MYTKITHTIVEEHFDNPDAVDIKAQWKAPLRYYTDGQGIPYNLPPSYAQATGENRCGSCLAFNPATSICGKFSAMVRPDYVCAAWTAIPS